ncbi:MAG: type II toxin-antitoxin system VapC family toxin [Sulfuricaulis sp.]
MNPVSQRAVVDASVAVKLFVPEPLSSQAQNLFVRFAQEHDAELVVPDLFFIECANVFWKWVQRSAYSAAAAAEHLRDLAALGLTTIPTQALAHNALELALKYRITAYDACYVAAATQLRFPLITADKKLLSQVSQDFDVRWLGDM